MSNQNNDDLDEQLYILLASMKEYREAIADDKKRLEQFYKYVADNVVDDIKKSVHIAQSNAAARLNDSAEKVQRSASRLDNKFIILFSMIFISLVFVVFLTTFLFIPSLDEIKQRRAEVAWLEQVHKLDLQRCDGQACVRVMKKQCNYGGNHDLCVIDPK